jgi:hypothetical protein
MAAISQDERAEAYSQYAGTSRTARKGGHAGGVAPDRGRRGLERANRESVVW